MLINVDNTSLEIKFEREDVAIPGDELLGIVNNTLQKSSLSLNQVTDLSLVVDAGLDKNKRNGLCKGFFNQVLPEMTGLTRVKIEGFLPGFVLLNALKQGNMQQIESLVFDITNHEGDELLPPQFYNKNMVQFLLNNKRLQELQFYDINEALPAPGKLQAFKDALINHPALKSFRNAEGVFEAFEAFEADKTLYNDSQLKASLGKKRPAHEIIQENQSSFNLNYEAALDIMRQIQTLLGEIENFDVRQVQEKVQYWVKGMEQLRINFQPPVLEDTDEATQNALNQYQMNFSQKESIIQKMIIPTLEVYRLVLTMQQIYRNNSNTFLDSEFENAVDDLRGFINQHVSERQPPSEVPEGFETGLEKIRGQLEKIYKGLPAPKQPQGNNSKYPQSYYRLTQGEGSVLDKAKSLLDDYTKGDSALSRFFHGHWNRHHVKAVVELVDRIDAADIQDLQSLTDALAKIKPANPNGSLARRMNFLKEHVFTQDDSSPQSRPGSGKT